MTRGFEVSKTLFENLVKHLVEIEEQKDKLLEEYFQEPSKERDELEKLIDNVTAQPPCASLKNSTGLGSAYHVE